jgi:hypothetical protein
MNPWGPIVVPVGRVGSGSCVTLIVSSRRRRELFGSIDAASGAESTK